MLLSMTGYGKAALLKGENSVSVEIRALNSKYTDVKLKIPQNLKNKELEIRKMISNHAERGKMDVNIEFELEGVGEEYVLNSELFKRYYETLSTLAGELYLPEGDVMGTIMRLPNVVQPNEQSVTEEEMDMLREVIEEALDELKRFRRDEGISIENDLKQRAQSILDLLSTLDPHEKERIERIRQRLYASLEKNMNAEQIDQNRFEQELIYYLEKMDVNEEKVRLEQHCKYFLDQIATDVTQKGRKLNFISQEIGREINTLGAKANSSTIQRIVIQMKDELEKIKEQVANVV